MRCTKTGRRCDGYLDAKTMAQRRRRTGPMPGGVACDPQAPPSLFFEWASAEEKRSFHFFQHVTAPCLSGDFDDVFWRVFVLQICQHEPAVKHAVLAVSSLHEGMTVPYLDADDRHSFALSQYNKAIACLLDQMRYVDARPLVPLLTCVLFVCIELMQNKDKESLLHLEQGRQILSQLGRKSSLAREVDIIKQHLVPMYTRLSLTSWLIGCDPVAIPTPLKLLTDVPMMYDSISDVRYALYDLMDECLRFAKRTHEAKFDEIPQSTMRAFEAEQEYLLRKLKKFNAAFSLYQLTKPRDAPPGAVALLQIHVHTTNIWLETALSNGETAYDDHISTFSSIIPLAASFMDAVTSPSRDYSAKATGSIAPPDPRRFSTTFTFEMHVIAPLFYVATKCRHPLIRRAALDLLRRNPARRENLWRANVMAAIADHTIRLEEKHLKMNRSASPSGPLPVSIPPFMATFVPADVWDSDMRDAPLHGVFRPQGTVPPSVPPPRSYAYDPNSIPTTNPESLDLSNLGGLGQLPIDPSLLYDAAEVNSSSAHSFSAAPSIASSFDDLTASTTIYVGGSTAAATSIATSMAELAASPLPGWGVYGQQHQQQQQQQHQQQHHQSHSSHQRQQRLAPEISLEPPTPMDRDDSWIFDSRPPSGVSSSSDESGIVAALSSPGLGPRSSDAPFDVPERFRVRESIIGPDKDDGLWVMMFRKLGGLDATWDVQTEYVVVS